MILRVYNRSTLRKTGPCSALPTTNLTWTNLRSNQGLRGEGPATNLLNRAFFFKLLYIYIYIVRKECARNFGHLRVSPREHTTL